MTDELLSMAQSAVLPRCADLAALNVYLRQRCTGEAGRTVAGYDDCIGQRFARDRAAALPLPPHPFDPCVSQAAQPCQLQWMEIE